MKYATEGYSPHKALLPYLGDFAFYVVYAPNAFNYKQKSFIEEVITRPFLRQQLSSVLRHLIVSCKYPETGKKILCTDLLNPHAIPDLSLYFDYEEHKWRFSPEKAMINSNGIGSYILIQDDFFLLAIRLNKKTDQVELFIYRK